MKRFSLSVMMCVVMVCVVCSAAMGAFKMDAGKFNTFCKNASAREVQNALNAGAEMSYDAWFTAAENNPDPQVLKLLLEEGRKYDVELLDARSQYGSTALMLSVRWNLINAGADVNIRRDDDMTALSLSKICRSALS